MKHILITGASSGIGGALAKHYSAQPNIMISICGRNAERLKKVANDCIENGTKVNSEIVDVSDKKLTKKWILSCDKKQAIDLIIANAGIGLLDSSLEAWEKTLSVNMDGVVNTIHAIIPKMIDRGYGQIALVSSIAGYRGMPVAPAYAASKAFVKSYGEGLRGNLKSHGIKVNVICPGFVRSRITDQNTCPMPFFMESEKAVKIITKGLEKNIGRIALPYPMVFAVWFLSILPNFLAEIIANKLPEK